MELPGQHQQLWHLQIVEIKLPERWFQIENEQGINQPQVAHVSLFVTLQFLLLVFTALSFPKYFCSLGWNGIEENGMERNRMEQNRTEQDRTEQNRTGQNSSVYFS